MVGESLRAERCEEDELHERHSGRPPGSSSLTAGSGSHSLPGLLCLFHVLS